jgi:hypothetical protein
MKIIVTLFLLFFVCLSLSSEGSATNDTEEFTVEKKKSTPFTHWSWLWAIGCFGTLVYIRQWLRGEIFKKAEINILDEFKNRDGAYRREDYEADTKNGALQTCKKDEEGLIKLKLSQRTRINHDTYLFR